jgi:hypothetical protein
MKSRSSFGPITRASGGSACAPVVPEVVSFTAAPPVPIRAPA